jgi:hypothetical protein
LKNVASLKFVASHALVINGGRRVEARGVGHLVEYLTAAIRKRDAWPLNVCSVFRVKRRGIIDASECRQSAGLCLSDEKLDRPRLMRRH